MKHPPFIKNFYDKITVNIYYNRHCTQCVMVAKTTLYCVMGCEIAQMWQCRPSTGRPKSRTKKCLFREKKCVNHTTFAVLTTGQLHETSTCIYLKNNF